MTWCLTTRPVKPDPTTLPGGFWSCQDPQDTGTEETSQHPSITPGQEQLSLFYASICDYVKQPCDFQQPASLLAVLIPSHPHKPLLH